MDDSDLTVVAEVYKNRVPGHYSYSVSSTPAENELADRRLMGYPRVTVIKQERVDTADDNPDDTIEEVSAFTR
jgi:hypothetical protein